MKLYRWSKKSKPKGEVTKKLNVHKLSGVSVTFGTNRALRPGSEVALNLPSHVTSTQFLPSRNSVMDAAQLAKESPEVRDAIIAKSKRLAPAYNKSGIQYISEETDLRTLGKKV